MSLFAPTPPLAERMRPTTLAGFIGQGHVVGEGALLRKAIEEDRLSSIILWGPPGCGKTTLARLIAHYTKGVLVPFSAVTGTLAELRIEVKAAQDRLLRGQRTILFVDEIHRFNKAQQDAFLPHVENGTFIVVGATTENPAFELIRALLSRSRVFVLDKLAPEHLEIILRQALASPKGLNGRVSADDEALRFLAKAAEGDARRALNALEAASLVGDHITCTAAEEALQLKTMAYDATGDEHHRALSAFHKSLRGSDPDASLYWAMRMIEGGEPPRTLFRRLLCVASEDIGNADPNALRLAVAAFQAFEMVGPPEGYLMLSQAICYLACAPKSNASYLALHAAQAAVKAHGPLPVPPHLINPTSLDTKLGTAGGYLYPHDFPGHVVAQAYLPDQLAGTHFYEPTEQGVEAKIQARLARLRTLTDTPSA